MDTKENINTNTNTINSIEINMNETIASEFSLKLTNVDNIITLIDEGNTIPFIARYRKEMTGSIDDQILRELHERLEYLRSIQEKKEQVKNSIAEQGKLTDEIMKALINAKTITEVDDIYRPYRPKRKTRASVAKEKGLEPFSNAIMEQESGFNIEEFAKDFVNEEKGVKTIQDAISGALDIIAENISDNANNRTFIRKMTTESGLISTKATKEEEESVYEMYYDFTEPLAKMAGHRVLALNRAEKEKFITVKIEAPVDEIHSQLEKLVIKQNSPVREHLEDTIADSYKRLIAPAISNEIRNMITETAEENAIKVFGVNLTQLLMQPPIKDKNVMALDPGFRTGCKVAVIDGTGKVLDTGVIYPTPPASKIEESKRKLIPLIEKHEVDIIAIGNGTASRETEQFTVDMIKEIDRKVQYIIVNESGASVYSASKLGSEEFPDYDVALRSSISIGRRLQDPLAELVKIDPKSIGVGQYQHDMNQKRLGEALGGVVEGCVNNIGVDLNTASPSLLSYISGISNTVSKNILAYREANGKFKNRKELLKVPKLGPKLYQQCAGFLRISDGDNPLDYTGVHPESYKPTLELLKSLDLTLDDVLNRNISGIRGKIKNTKETAEMLGIGEPTLIDITKELEKPGRDPRDNMPQPILASDLLDIKDLAEGMIMQGTVRNVIDFGAFVDIGVHQDGLVHISQISDKFIKHPLDAVKVGDIVTVKVLSVEVKKNRIALTMKGIN